MKINRETIKRQTIEEFADEHGLDMKVTERHKFPSPCKFYANFEGADVKEGSAYVGAYGDGATEEEAIRNYAARISETTLVIDAFKPQQREIIVPVLVRV